MNTKLFDITDFTKIRACGAVMVEIIQAAAYKVSVLAGDFDYIRVEKAGDTLVVGRRGFDWLLPFHSHPEFRIELPVLSDLRMSGATRGRAAGFQSDRPLTLDISGASHLDIENITAGSLYLQLSGASHLKGKIKTGKTALNIAGASHLKLEGAAADMMLEASGASHINLFDFRAQNATVQLSGASQGTININGKLDTHLNGASNLRWSGTAVMGEMEINGASSIQRR